jgi:hypothetical protein
MCKTKIINGNFYLKNGLYNKSFFDLCKVYLTDVYDSEVIFNDVIFNLKSFLEKFSQDSRYVEFLKKRSEKIKRKQNKYIIESKREELTSNISWLQEYILELSKYKKLNAEEKRLFDELEDIDNKFFNYHKLSNNHKISLIDKRDKLVKESFVILNINEEIFIQFISDKKNGVFAKKILERGLMDNKK